MFRYSNNQAEPSSASKSRTMIDLLEDLLISKEDDDAPITANPVATPVPEKVTKLASSSRPLSLSALITETDDLDIDLEIDDTIDTTVSPSVCTFLYSSQQLQRRSFCLKYVIFLFILLIHYINKRRSCLYITISASRIYYKDISVKMRIKKSCGNYLKL